MEGGLVMILLVVYDGGDGSVYYFVLVLCLGIGVFVGVCDLF